MLTTLSNLASEDPELIKYILIGLFFSLDVLAYLFVRYIIKRQNAFWNLPGLMLIHIAFIFFIMIAINDGCIKIPDFVACIPDATFWYPIFVALFFMFCFWFLWIFKNGVLGSKEPDHLSGVIHIIDGH